MSAPHAVLKKFPPLEKPKSPRLAAAGVLACAALIVLPAGAWARTVPNAGPPVPGGVYTGTADNGARVIIWVAADTPNGAIRGTLKLACAPGRASFQSTDGAFIATQRAFKATGRFEVDRLAGQIGEVAGGSGCGRTRYRAKLSSHTGVQSKVVRYGRFDLNAMRMSMPMPSNMFNMQGSMQVFLHKAQKPCSDCYVVGMVPELVYPNGKVANYNTGVMLHHIVLSNASQRDASCPTWPQRVFASGNERTDMVLPAGYGYHVAAADNWMLLAELMNMSMNTQSVEVQITYYYLPASARVDPVKPLWLDENNCHSSEYSIPVGRSDKVWHYQVPHSIAGDIVEIIGHVHDYGLHVSATDTTTGDLICDSRAGYRENMAYLGNIESMSGCSGDPLARIRPADTLRLDSFYDSPVAENDVMGIMIAYVDPGDQQSPTSVRGNSK
jgi:hypothetical protein